MEKHQTRHLRIDHICDICQKVFMTKANLKLHSKAHGGDQTRVQCEKCLKSTTNLANHKKYCDNIRNFSCTVCSKNFHFACVMMRHVEAVHWKQRNFKCSICPKAYTDATPLRHHVNTAHGDGSTFSHCTHCKKTFTTLRRFQEHNAKFHKEN